MKKKIGLWLLFSFILFAVGGCGQRGEENYEVVLSGNINSGYEWYCEENPEQIVTMIKNEYTEPEKEGEEGKYSFVFAGKNSGETELVFQYINGENNEILKTMRISLQVKKDKTIVEKDIQKDFAN